MQPQRGPGIVEPVGYAVSQFVTSIALVAGIGLAPNGLLLAAAAIIGSVLDLRRFTAANPGVIPETPEEFEGPRGQVLRRFSLQAVAVMIALSALGLWSVHHDQAQAAALGPALVAGVVTLWLNWRVKTALTKIDLAELIEAKARDEAIAAEFREIDEREDG
ncbi:MAG: hypothetical protein REI11_07805 [Patulibacter sp.]|nr:hypothetical protein [Patulibacter sp.]